MNFTFFQVWYYVYLIIFVPHSLLSVSNCVELFVASCPLTVYHLVVLHFVSRVFTDSCHVGFSCRRFSRVT